MSDAYGGYPNRETWALVMWVGNNQNLLNLVRLSDNAKHLEELIEDLFDPAFGNPFGEPDRYTMLHDIGSLYRIDWQRVYDRYKGAA